VCILGAFCRTDCKKQSALSEILFAIGTDAEGEAYGFPQPETLSQVIVFSMESPEKPMFNHPFSRSVIALCSWILLLPACVVDSNQENVEFQAPGVGVLGDTPSIPTCCKDTNEVFPYTGKYGRFTDGTSPTQNYSNNLNNCYTITNAYPKTRIKASVTRLEKEDSYDFLRVYDSKCQLIDNAKLNTSYYDNNQLTFHFVTDKAIVDKGFTITYSVEESSKAPPEEEILK
jgi:hypothetical protein